MEYIDEIEAGFRATVGLREYRINLGEQRSIGVGIRDNDVGSVYTPFSGSEVIAGSFLVQWDDGRLSRGTLDGNTVAVLPAILQGARFAAFDDPDAAQFLAAQAVHPVERWSADVAALLHKPPDYIFETIKRLQALARRWNITMLSGGAGIGESRLWLRTSQGLQLEDRSTTCSFSVSFDGMLGDGDQQRTLIDPPAIDAQVDQVGQFMAQLRWDTKMPHEGATTVILHPDVAVGMINYFVWGNLGGGAVFHGQSGFKAADFEGRRQVFDAGFGLRVDPWQPLGPDSFSWTSEGVPSKPTTYIEDGRLIQPVLDLKYARRLGLEPTTPPSGSRSVQISARTTITLDQALAGIQQGILVLRVLGLHTQDRSSGRYSLAAPQALLINDGRVVGPIRATLSGNFFEHLRSGESQLVTFPYQPGPGLVFVGPVSWG
ncbi:MAG: metallopeptidase TldD-related protein [Herpetosiphon sp.]